MECVRGKYIEQRETTELARSESWGIGFGEAIGDGEPSPSRPAEDFLRWNRDFREFCWFLMKLSSIPTFASPPSSSIA